MSVVADVACGNVLATRSARTGCVRGLLALLVMSLVVGHGDTARAVDKAAAERSDGALAQPTITALDNSLAITHYVVTPDGTNMNVAALPGDLVYSNTTGESVVTLGLADRRIADDIRTTAGCGCKLSGFEFMLYGNGDGTGPGFTVNYALYDSCPGNGGVVIPGTEGSAYVDNDGLSLVSVDLGGAGPDVGRAFWLGMTFDRANVGWITGAPAELGLTLDIYDLYASPCNASFQGSNLHAGFYATAYCEGGGAPYPPDGGTQIPVDADLTWSTYGIDPTGGGTPSPLTGSPDPTATDGSWANNLAPGERCGTQARYEARVQASDAGGGGVAGGCLLEGYCDDPVIRDAFIPDASTPIKTYAMFIHVFCESDGSGCAATQASVDGTMARVNADYLPYRIQWVYETAFHNDTDLLHWTAGEEYTLKHTYAVSPAEMLNVYVVIVQGNYSYGTFPWDNVALQFGGGIVMHKYMFGPTDSTLTHESGHNLGLWHTHHGVSEVPDCSACYEEAGSPSDTRGDFCSDTAPTPTNYYCSGPPGNDPCSGNLWAPTDTDNFMGYAGSPCWQNFSDMQAGRMHCWTDDRLTGWLTSGCGATYDVYFDVDNPPTTLLCSGSDVPFCDPGALSPDVTYFWRVVASNDVGSNEGPVWSFTTAAVVDCNQNGIPDGQELASGSALDCNGNTVLDECEVIAGGDFNADGTVDAHDQPGFVECLSGPASPPAPQPPDCISACIAAFDFDGNGRVDLSDYSAFLQAAAAP